MSDSGTNEPSLSFGGDARLYDRARPPYPAAAIELISSDGVTDVLDVGCGTGIVSRLLRDRGCRCLGVEPDARMADVARRHGVEVEVATFEAWDADGRIFDLVVSGMAWHWVDTAVGSSKVADVLRDGGAFAAMWNYFDLPEHVRDAIAPAYERSAPTLMGTALVLAGSPDRSGPDRDADALLATGAFSRVWRDELHWPHQYTTSTWVDELATRSSHRTLPDDIRTPLLAGVASAVDAIGGGFEVRYTTTILRAERKPRA